MKSEGSQLVGYVYVDVAGRDLGSYVQEAQADCGPTKSTCLKGYHLNWSGQYEYMQRAKARLMYVVPLTLLIVFLLLYLNFQSIAQEPHRPSLGAVCRYRSHLVIVPSQIQPQRRGVGWHHCP